MEVKSEYKMTELGEIPVDWEVKRIEEITTVETGGTPLRSNSHYWNNGSIPWMSSGEINKKFIEFVEEKISKEGYENSNTRLLPKGTVMIAMNGQGKTRGSVAYLQIETTCNQSLAGIMPNNNFDSLFLYYYLEASYDKLRSINGEGRSGLNLSLIRQFKVIIPLLKEQQKIAQILSTVDEQIEQTDQLIEKTNKLKNGLMQQLLTKGIRHTIFKQTELGKIPVDWNICSYDTITERITVGIATSTTKHYVQKGVPMIRNQNIKDNKITFNDLLFISSEFDEKNKNKRLKENDIVTVRTGYPGKSAVVPKKLENAQSFTTLISTPNKNIVNSEYLSYYINSSVGMQQLENMSAGGAQKNLNAASLRNLKVILPKMKEQQMIASVLASVDEEIEGHQEEKAKYIELKRGLMQQLLTGKTRVNID